MKTKQYYIITILAAFLLFAVSCEKEDVKTSGNKEVTNQSRSLVGPEENYLIEEMDEELRYQLTESLISFNLSISEYYQEGMTYEELLDVLEVDREKLDIIGSDLLILSHFCLENNFDDEFLFENYNGKEMLFVLDWYSDNQDSDGAELFGVKVLEDKAAPCKWYAIGCHLGKLWDWITDADRVEEVMRLVNIAKTVINFWDWVHNR